MKHSVYVKNDSGVRCHLYVYTSEDNSIKRICLPGDLLEITDKLSKSELVRVQHRIDVQTAGTYRRSA